MRVTPNNKPFGKHAVGTIFELPDKTARALIFVGKLRAADDADQEAATQRTARRSYRRRDMQPEE